MKQPPYLKKGDTIAIVATARKIADRSQLDLALQTFERWGLKVRLGKSIGLEDHQFSGTDAERAADLQWALDDPTIKGIICARGGYGTVRIIDRINFKKFKRQPKWIAGFSDITVLHSACLEQGIQSIHSTMCTSMPTNTEAAISSLKNALFGESLTYSAPPHPLNRLGEAEGCLVGGNLSLIYSQLGSATDVNTKGKILLLEDLDEYLYHVDRMIMALKRAGKFAKLKGLIIGGMTDMNDNTIPFGKTANEIIAEHVAEYDFPVCYRFPAGHIHDNRALVIGGELRLRVGEKEVSANY